MLEVAVVVKFGNGLSMQEEEGEGLVFVECQSVAFVNKNRYPSKTVVWFPEYLSKRLEYVEQKKLRCLVRGDLIRVKTAESPSDSEFPTNVVDVLAYSIVIL